MAQPPAKKYGVALVAQSNRLIEAFHSMSLTEKRLFIYLSIIARQHEGLKDSQIFTIRAEDFAADAGLHKDNAYHLLQDACYRLYRRELTYMNEKGHPIFTRWVTKLEYIKGSGEIVISLPQSVIQMITIFNKDNPFTVYERKQIQKMSSVYAIRFYELFMQRRDFGQRLFEVDYLKKMFQLEDKYDRVSNLKLRVIDPAIEQINQHTNYTVTYQQIKNGKTVVSFMFTFFPKQNVEKNVEKLVEECGTDVAGDNQNPETNPSAEIDNAPLNSEGTNDDLPHDEDLLQASNPAPLPHSPVKASVKPTVQTSPYFLNTKSDTNSDKPPVNAKNYRWYPQDRNLLKQFQAKCPKLLESHIIRIADRYNQQVDVVLATINIHFGKSETFTLLELPNAFLPKDEIQTA